MGRNRKWLHPFFNLIDCFSNKGTHYSKVYFIVVANDVTYSKKVATNLLFCFLEC